VAGSTANAINTLEIIDDKDDIPDVNQTLKVVGGPILVLLVLKVVMMYKLSVQRRRDQHHALENVVTHIGA